MFPRRRKAVALALVTAAALYALPTAALDARYKDADGDLVADAPTDPKDFVDPPVLIFAYTPVEDPAVYAKVWDSFLKHLEKTTGKRVQFFPVQSNAAQIEGCEPAVCMWPASTRGYAAGGQPRSVRLR